jgi:hypothetical protein
MASNMDFNQVECKYQTLEGEVQNPLLEETEEREDGIELEWEEKKEAPTDKENSDGTKAAKKACSVLGCLALWLCCC